MEKETISKLNKTFEAVSDHFVDVNKMIKIGSGAERKQEDIMLLGLLKEIIMLPGRILQRRES